MANRTAIVTGAGKRIGAYVTRSLIEGGWSVVAHVREAADIVPDGAIKVVADLSDPDCASTIFAAASGMPPVGLLINNAARFSFDAFGAFSAAEFDRHMATNLRAPIMLIEELAAGHRGGDASVINLLDAKLQAPNPDFLSYTLSKQALGAATELAARALAPKGIRVNGIAPALMLRSNGQSEANFRAMHTANALGRGVRAEDVAEAIRYLACATRVTGQVITIDAGQRFMGLTRDVQFLEDE